MKPSFYEFFAGGGMVRAGLGSGWQCVFANDFDLKKGRVYVDNWGDRELKNVDIATLSTRDLPGTASLAWASFPCQDLSLAGAGAGLKGERSGTFWPFWNMMKGLIQERRSPRVIVLENVCGALTSHNGRDFSAICSCFAQAGYHVGALVVDAALFVPQSRPRLFIIGFQNGISVPQHLVSNGPVQPWHTRALQNAHGKLSGATKATWVWWNLPTPPQRVTTFAGMIDAEADQWFNDEETNRLLEMMSVINRKKVEDAKGKGSTVVGGIYRRTRPDQYGRKVQRAEVRFDDMSGCLRTPAGGSSRQVVLVVNGAEVRARLISTRETARLMGLPDSYRLPERYNEAYHLTGDGVVVPVVRHLADHIFEPLLGAGPANVTVAA